jgi:hypothetical protein
MITRPRLSMPAAAGQPVRDRARRRGHGSPAGYAGKRGACEVRSSAQTVPSSQRSRVPGSLPRRKDLVSPAGRRGQPSCASTAVGLLADLDSQVSLAFPGRFGCQDRAGWLSPKRMAAWLANVGILRPGRSRRTAPLPRCPTRRTGGAARLLATGRHRYRVGTREGWGHRTHTWINEMLAMPQQAIDANEGRR